MGIYEAVKDVAQIVQKADNIELYKMLLDVQKMALDMQDEVTKLREENKALKDMTEFAKKIERHENTYVTLNDDEAKTLYCSCCWDSDKKLIQVNVSDDGSFKCPKCGNKGLFSKEMKEQYTQRQMQAIANMNSNLHRKSIWDNIG